MNMRNMNIYNFELNSKLRNTLIFICVIIIFINLALSTTKSSKGGRLIGMIVSRHILLLRLCGFCLFYFINCRVDIFINFY